MDDDGRYRDGRQDFIRGAKDIAKVAKKQVGKKIGRGADKMADEYTKRSYKRFEEEDDDDDYAGVPGNDGGYYRNDSRANDDEGHSDSTEGHDEDDEIYEGEYQGIPRADSGKAGSIDGVTAAQAQQFRDLSAYEGEEERPGGAGPAVRDHPAGVRPREVPVDALLCPGAGVDGRRRGDLCGRLRAAQRREGHVSIRA